MQTFSYYSRNLLVEQVQKVIFTNKTKPIGWFYYLNFTLPWYNRVSIVINSINLYTECFIKYENRGQKNVSIFKGHIKNSLHIEHLSRIIDKQVDELNLKHGVNLNSDFWDFGPCDFDFDSLQK